MQPSERKSKNRNRRLKNHLLGLSAQKRGRVVYEKHGNRKYHEKVRYEVIVKVGEFVAQASYIARDIGGGEKAGLGGLVESGYCAFESWPAVRDRGGFLEELQRPGNESGLGQ